MGGKDAFSKKKETSAGMDRAVVQAGVVLVSYSCNQYTIQEAFKQNYAKVSRTGLNPI